MRWTPSVLSLGFVVDIGPVKWTRECGCRAGLQVVQPALALPAPPGFWNYARGVEEDDNLPVEVWRKRVLDEVGSADTGIAAP